ncbi:MAG: PAS domain S-box protein, partial [Gemmatimonadetes bacterium]|nr:PAS domain S-box protein [Gemmatimonadota bacterium]
MDQPAPLGTGAVRSSDATFRALFQQAAIGIALVDTEGRPFESNPALQAMLGYTADELRTLTNSDLTHPEDLRESLRLFGEMINGQRDSYRIEKRYVRQDGGIVWGRLTASLVRDGDGRPSFVIAMIEDVTEWKQAEQALREWAITDDLTG